MSDPNTLSTEISGFSVIQIEDETLTDERNCPAFVLLVPVLIVQTCIDATSLFLLGSTTY